MGSIEDSFEGFDSIFVLMLGSFLSFSFDLNLDLDWVLKVPQSEVNQYFFVVQALQHFICNSAETRENYTPILCVLSGSQTQLLVIFLARCIH